MLDVHSFRVLVPTRDDCYRALGVIHELYKPVPGRFKDFVAIPKANGYQSLHTTVIGPGGLMVEFQIRTEEMHHICEDGITAHWLYPIEFTSSLREAELSSCLKGQQQLISLIKFILTSAIAQSAVKLMAKRRPLLVNSRTAK